MQAAKGFNSFERLSAGNSKIQLASFTKEAKGILEKRKLAASADGQEHGPSEESISAIQLQDIEKYFLNHFTNKPGGESYGIMCMCMYFLEYNTLYRAENTRCIELGDLTGLNLKNEGEDEAAHVVVPLVLQKGEDPENVRVRQVHSPFGVLVLSLHGKVNKLGK